MEVDEPDLDCALLQQFSCMGTTDREVLISQFYKLVGDAANERDAAFYLDMNNWNLQEAVGAYFDLQSGPAPLLPTPCLLLLEDASAGAGSESVPPDTEFVKTWHVKNGGRETWPAGCQLRFLHGCQLSEQMVVQLGSLAPDQVAEVSVCMRSPAQPGIYQSKWRATTAGGTHFGDVIWVILTVQPEEEREVAAVTQQMTRLTEQLGTSPLSQHQPPAANPFCAESPPRPTALQPALHGSQPAVYGPQPAGYGPQPAVYGPQPAVYDPQPQPHGLPPFTGVNGPGRPAPEQPWTLPNADADMD